MERRSRQPVGVRATTIHLPQIHYLCLGPSSGGNAIYDDATKLWQLYVTEIAGAGCGLHNWQGHSTVVHATSTSVTGPYQKQQVVLPSQAHNPQAIKIGVSWYIFHIGTATGSSTPAAACNETLPPDAGLRRTAKSDRQEQPSTPASWGSVAKGATGSTIHKSDRPEGPFTPVAQAPHCNNPSPAVHPNGTLFLACTWTIQKAAAPEGPWSEPLPLQPSKPNRWPIGHWEVSKLID